MLDEQEIWLWNYSQSDFFSPMVVEDNIFAWWVSWLAGNLYDCVQEEIFGWWGITCAGFQQAYGTSGLALNL